jgi:hypothetical protein
LIKTLIGPFSGRGKAFFVPARRARTDFSAHRGQNGLNQTPAKGNYESKKDPQNSDGQ